MKQISIACFCGIIVCVIFVLASGGCMSVSNSPAPRFYMLHAVDEKQAGRKFDIAPGMIIGVNPVKIPGYQNRPQIVTQDKNKMLTFAQFDRWGESLNSALTRLMMENLSIMLPQATIELFPGNLAVPVKYQVVTDVLQLESQLDKDLFFVAQWSVIDVQKKKMVLIKKSEFRQPIDPHDYAGLVEALSAASASLSGEIAAALAALANQPETK